MSLKIYTRTGDEGDTGLFGGGRVPKDHPRVAAYGDVDELSSALGVVRATPPAEFFDGLFESVQRDLFSIGGHLATPDPEKVARALEKAELSDMRVAELERVIDMADGELPPLRAFVLPAGTPKAAALHLARTVCRRAERCVVTLAAHEAVSDPARRYLNRLSDLLFVLARVLARQNGGAEVQWNRKRLEDG
jgi:cob(I)alamin adenosyltransferase